MSDSPYCSGSEGKKAERTVEEQKKCLGLEAVWQEAAEDHPGAAKAR